MSVPMTTYFSTFFLDPVVRQARRFSRPSFSSDTSWPNYNVAAPETASEAPQSLPVDSGDEEERQRPSTEAIRERRAYAPRQREAHSRIRSPSTYPAQSQPAFPYANQGGFSESAIDLELSRSDAMHEERQESASHRGGTSENTGDPSVEAEFPREQTSTITSSRPAGRSDSAASDLHSINHGALPADDGQRQVRKKILEIRDMDVSASVKARMMHAVMAESYTASPAGSQYANLAQSQSPSSFNSPDRPFTPLSGLSGSILDAASPRAKSPTSIGEAGDLSNVTGEDIKPTFVPQKPKDATTSSSEKPDEQSETQDESLPRLGCEHYMRNVKLQCSACHRWYTCRFCHDEAEDHSLNRRETKNMLCMRCGHPQPAGDVCVKCSGRTAWYYCNICKLWDDDSDKSIYHCNDCGICRIGQGLGKDFYHCKKCSVCMSISIAGSHRCIERSTDCDCPICGDYMFTSPLTVVFMLCGHSIHHKCYYDHMKSSYKCPICSRSIVNMETQFRNLDRTIESQPMPPQFQDTKALVYCNDCCNKSKVRYHWLGLKCGICDSYNTAQIQILSSDAERPTSNHVQSRRGSISQSPGISRQTSRGRTARGTTAQNSATVTRSSSPTQRRPPMFTSASAHANAAFPLLTLPQRIGRSASPAPRVGASRFMDRHRVTGDDRGDRSDSDDLGFWGGDAPRDWLLSQSESDDEESDDEEDEDDEDSFGSERNYNEDLEMVDRVESQESGDDDEDVSDSSSSTTDEADDLDAMELIGHR